MSPTSLVMHENEQRNLHTVTAWDSKDKSASSKEKSFYPPSGNEMVWIFWETADQTGMTFIPHVER